jgi:hypothetical protein
MNHDLIATLPDGSRLVLSTRYIGDTNFRCELYRMFNIGDSVYRVEAPTCREAQSLACAHATRIYGGSVVKKPPYLIWSSAITRFEPQRRRSLSFLARHGASSG